MTEKSAIMFNHNLYSKPKVDQEDTGIPHETRQKLIDPKENYDFISKHSSNIRLTYLGALKIDTGPNLPPVASKPYPLPLKHHKFVKEEIENFLEAGLIERSLSPYATPITVDPR